MHIPDGFIDVRTSAAFAAASVAAVGVGLRGARRQLSERSAPMAGLTAVYIFAAQMINFPVASGTSGHLIGGALAAILVGPYAGLLAMAAVLLIQSLMFADGGLTALGLNVFNMGVITVLTGWLIFRLAMRILPNSSRATVLAAGLAAFVSVPASAAGFVLQYALGGTGTFSVTAVLSAMFSVHVLIGIGEAIITALTVGAVLAVRPDLVRGTTTKGWSTRKFVAVGAGVSGLLAGGVSLFASANPDGLERVAIDKGFAESARDSAVASSPFADYSVALLGDSRVAGSVAGIVGIGVMAVVGWALFAVVRRRPEVASEREPATGEHDHSASHHQHLPAPHQHPRASHGHDHGHLAEERFYIHRHSPVHQLAPHLKIAAVFTFVLMVVIAPRDAYLAFAIHAVLLLAVIVIADLRYRQILPRLVVEVPFLFFAVLMPFFGSGTKVEFLGISLYESGLVAGGAILIKGTLGVLAAVTLAATTPARDIIAGLQRLRFPSLIVEIASFMLRYVGVVLDELRRMTIAQQSRGFLATGPKQWRSIARTSGALFIRSYERGERVHLAMLSRGYSGKIPELSSHSVTTRDAAMAALLPLLAFAISLLALGGLL